MDVPVGRSYTTCRPVKRRIEGRGRSHAQTRRVWTGWCFIDTDIVQRHISRERRTSLTHEPDTDRIAVCTQADVGLDPWIVARRLLLSEHGPHSIGPGRCRQIIHIHPQRVHGGSVHVVVETKIWDAQGRGHYDGRSEITRTSCGPSGCLKVYIHAPCRTEGRVVEMRTGTQGIFIDTRSIFCLPARTIAWVSSQLPAIAQGQRRIGTLLSCGRSSEVLTVRSGDGRAQCTEEHRGEVARCIDPIWTKFRDICFVGRSRIQSSQCEWIGRCWNNRSCAWSETSRAILNVPLIRSRTSVGPREGGIVSVHGHCCH